jgi:hypothetical protein
MEASVGHAYSKLDKRHEYYCDALNNWTWFEMGHSIRGWEAKHMELFPYFPASFKGKKYTYNSPDAIRLGRKCAKRLLLLFYTNEKSTIPS